MVQVQPGIILVTPGHGHNVLHPAPAFLDVTLGYEYLKEALCPAFVVHQCAVRLGESTRRQYHIGPRAGFMVDVVDDHDVLGGGKKPVDRRSVGAPIKIVFKDNNCVGGSFSGISGISGTTHRLKCRFEAGAAYHRRAKAVAFGNRKAKLRRVPAIAQRPRYVGCRLNDGRIAAAHAGDNEGTLRVF